MRLVLVTTDNLRGEMGEMSRGTYDSIPSTRRPQLYAGDYFLIGDLERPPITVRVVEDSTLASGVLYLSDRAKSIYYSGKPHIDIA